MADSVRSKFPNCKLAISNNLTKKIRIKLTKK